MTITIPPELEPALTEQAGRANKTPEQYAVELLRPYLTPAQPQPSLEEWQTLLRRNRVNAGVSLSDEAVSRESLYD